VNDHLRLADARLTVALEYLARESDPARAVALATFQLKHAQHELGFALTARSALEGSHARRGSDLMDNLHLGAESAMPELTLTLSIGGAR